VLTSTESVLFISLSAYASTSVGRCLVHIGHDLIQSSRTATSGALANT
jgi:hypothetical protein